MPGAVCDLPVWGKDRRAFLVLRLKQPGQPGAWPGSQPVLHASPCTSASATPPLPAASRYSCDVLISLEFLQVVKKLNSPLTTNLYFLPLYCRKLFLTKSNFTSFYLLNFIILLYFPRLSDSLPFLNLKFK